MTAADHPVETTHWNAKTLERRLKGLMFFRVLLVTSLFGAAIFANAQTVTALSTPRNILHLGMIISTYALTIAYALLLPRLDRLEPLAYFQIGTDLVLAILLVSTTGGLRTSAFLFTLYLPIIAAALLTQQKFAIGCACFVSLFILQSAATALGAFDTPHPLDVIITGPTRAIITEASVNILFAFLLAWSSGELAKQLGEAKSDFEQSQADLLELQALNQNILASLNSGLLTLDQDDRIIFFNKAAEQISGLRSQHVLGSSLGELFPTLVDQLSATPSNSQQPRFEGPFVTPSGEELYLGFSTSPLLDASGTHNGQIIIFQDLSLIKALREQAQRSEQMAAIGQLSAAIAHEIRNPLASISGSVEMLQMLATLSEDEDALMNIIIKEVERLNELISDFLDFSRPKQLHKEPTFLPDLVEETLQLFRHRSHDITLTYNALGARTKRPIMLDREAIRVLMWNLLNNAADAMNSSPSQEPPEMIPLAPSDFPLSSPLPSIDELSEELEASSKHIDVTLEAGDTHITLSVEDNGPGISDEIAKHIFEPFFTTKTTGTGLGLATSFRLIEDHGGILSIENPTRLQGARFVISLPIEHSRVKGGA